MPGLLVIKVGGARGNRMDGAIADIRALRAEGRPIVLVHGGSGETDSLCEALGEPPRFLDAPGGQRGRDTDRTTLERFAMATALVNRRWVEALRGQGLDALGISGLDAGLVRARRKASTRAVIDGRTVVVRDQWTGRLTGLREGLLRAWLDEGLLPVIAPLACSDEGEMLNVDGDRLAALVASGLGAEQLLLLTNVPGILRDQTDDRSLVTHLSIQDLDRIDGFVHGRMRKKVLGAREALMGGVGRVVIAASHVGHPVMGALAGHGTIIGCDPIEREIDHE